MRRMMLGVLTMMLGWILAPGLAHAVALGKIDVTSHLGEPFYAEIPLTLEKGEKLSGVTVDIAQPSDYRVLEVYRDPVLNAIRTNVQDDKRGPRIKLVSDSAIESPFFNLVLKVHYGNATSFKKYPVFLDLPSAVVSTRKPQPAPKPKVQAPKPEVSKPEVSEPQPAVTQAPASQPAKATATTQEKPASTAQSTGKGGAPFKPYSGWARIGRYGPMVYGDTLMTVARRLRVDDRYTIKQVMVALFDKNKDKFDKNNMNLIKAGSYLKVPTAKEVAAITPRQAIKAVAEQDRAWQALKKQPRYAAVDKAQKTRYSARVKVGEVAEGVPSATATPVKEAQGATSPSTGKAQTSPAAATAPAPAKSAAPASAKAVTPAKTASELQALQQQNSKLQQQLKQANQSIAALNEKLSSSGAAASQASLKKLELRLARMQTQLDAARQQAAMAAKGNINNMLVYGLGGLAVLLLAVIGYLLRRERPHPASQLQSEPESSFEDELSEQAPAGMFGEDVASPKTESFGEDESQASPFAEEAAFGDEAESVEDEGIPPVGDEVQSAPVEEVDQNVDYVAEADVYLRYGMEEEALRQLKMAVRQSEGNVDAHCKLVKVLHGRGDQDALDAAVEEGKRALSGDALMRFESEVAQLDSEDAGGVAADEDSDGTLDFDQGGTTDFSAGDDAGGEESGLMDVGVPAGEEAEEVGEVDLSDSDSAGLGLEGVEWSLGGEEEQEAEAAPDEGAAEDELSGVGSLSMDEEIPEETTEPSIGGDEDEPSAAQAVADTDTADEDEASEGDAQAEHELEFSLGSGEEETAPPADTSPEEELPEAAETETSDLTPEMDIDLSLDEAISEVEQAYGGGDEAGSDAVEDVPESESESEGDRPEEASDQPQDTEQNDLLDDVELDLSGLMIDEEDEEPAEPDEASATGEEDHHADEVSRELDDLLDELGIDNEAEMDDAGADTDGDEQPSGETVSAGSLAIDMARSLVARGMLDDAEVSFQSALEGDFRGQALLGLAEVAQARGEMAQAAEILTEAEPLLDEGSREWFETLKEKQGE